MALVTIDEAARHLRIDLETDEASPPTVTDERLADLEEKLASAEEVIIDYLKYRTSGWDEQTAPRPVKAAILLILAGLWENRDGSAGDYLANDGAVARLLRRFRDPTMA